MHQSIHSAQKKLAVINVARYYKQVIFPFELVGFTRFKRMSTFEKNTSPSIFEWKMFTTKILPSNSMWR